MIRFIGGSRNFHQVFKFQWGRGSDIFCMLINRLYSKTWKFHRFRPPDYSLDPPMHRKFGYNSYCRRVKVSSLAKSLQSAPQNHKTLTIVSMNWMQNVNLNLVWWLIDRMVTVIWLKYCQCGVKHQSINQSINQSTNQSINQSISQSTECLKFIFIRAYDHTI